MVASIRSEFRKLLTVRTTYVFAALVLAIGAFLSFYVFGMRGGDAAESSSYLVERTMFLVSTLSLFITLPAILLVTNEYRHNTILYTLTLAKTRSQVLLAKLAVAAAFSLVLTLILVGLSLVLIRIGVSTEGGMLGMQNVDVWGLLWRTSFYVVGYTLFSALVASIIRNQIGAIVFLLVVPGTIEGLLSLLIKDNVRYLPFNALTSTLQLGDSMSAQLPNMLPATTGALVFAGYLVVLAAVSGALLMKRDAN